LCTKETLKKILLENPFCVRPKARKKISAELKTLLQSSRAVECIKKSPALATVEQRKTKKKV
jgi:hypothetical protein